MKKVLLFSLALLSLCMGSCSKDESSPVTPTPQPEPVVEKSYNVRYIGYLSNSILDYNDIKLFCATGKDTVELAYKIEAMDTLSRDKAFWTKYLEKPSKVSKENVLKTKVLVPNNNTKITNKADTEFFIKATRNKVALPADGIIPFSVAGYNIQLETEFSEFIAQNKFAISYNVNLTSDPIVAEETYAKLCKSLFTLCNKIVKY